MDRPLRLVKEPLLLEEITPGLNPELAPGEVVRRSPRFRGLRCMRLEATPRMLSRYPGLMQPIGFETDLVF